MYVQQIANIARGSHAERDLHRWVGRQDWKTLLPDTFAFDMVISKDQIHEDVISQKCILPHELFSSLFFNARELFSEMLSGDDDNLKDFWDDTSNLDPMFYRLHPVEQIRTNPNRTVPIAIYGDDSGLYQVDKFLLVLWGSPAVVNNTLDSRLFFIAVQYRWLIKDRSLEEVYKVLHWSITCLSEGFFPECDHNGKRFDANYYPKRAALANQPLTSDYFRGAFSEMRGDWKYQREALLLDRYYGVLQCCHLCSAHKRTKRLLFTQFGRNVPLRNTLVSNRKFLDQLPVRSYITRIPGFWIWRCWVDSQHALDLGFFQSVNASLICEACHDFPIFPAETVQGRFDLAHYDYKSWCKRFETDPAPRFRAKKIMKNQLTYPEWTQQTAKAAQTRHMIKWWLDVLSRHPPATVYEGVRFRMVRNLVRFIDICSRNGRTIAVEDREPLQSAMEKALCSYNWLAGKALENNKCRWELLPKAHMCTHLAYDMALVANPVAVSCYSDEDMVGRVKRMLLKAHGTTAGSRAADRYSILVGLRWWKRLAEIRGVRRTLLKIKKQVC